MLGYRPETIGLTRTYFLVDNLNTPEQTAIFHPEIQAIADDGTIDHAGFLGRYGVAPEHLKKWNRAPNNEVKYIAHDAMIWLAKNNRPGFSETSGVPTEQEVTDFQAVGDQRFREYMVSELDSFSPQHPVHVNDPSRPYGPYTSHNDFWNMVTYYFNDSTEYNHNDPPPPPPPPPMDDITQLKNDVSDLRNSLNSVINLLNSDFAEVQSASQAATAQLANHAIMLNNQRQSLAAIRTTLANLIQRVTTLEGKK